jgi:hypothetical protein
MQRQRARRLRWWRICGRGIGVGGRGERGGVHFDGDVRGEVMESLRPEGLSYRLVGGAEWQWHFDAGFVLSGH